jgi:predicted ATPase
LLSVRGAAAPVQAWLLHRLRDTAALPDVEWHLTPFVGRDRELGLLARLAQEADAGRGRAVLLVGEPGVGKSRLLRELARIQAAAGWDVATTQGVSHLRLPPLHGAVEVLSNMLPGGHGTTGPQEIAPELAAHAEALTAMAGKDTSAWRALPPAQRRVQVARAALAALAVRSQGRPLLVLVDDLQWVDPDSREIFRQIADAAGGARMLLVAACRADDAIAHPGAWFHLPLATWTSGSWSGCSTC